MSATASRETPATAIDIRPFTPADAPAFFTLNEAWIAPLFGMEDRDQVTLGNPQQTILDPGGEILMAFLGDRPVACCALIPEPGHDGVYELAKMSVAGDLRGHGIGRRLLLAAVALARTLGAHRLTLGSSTRLPNAVHLYESIGFRHIPEEQRPPILLARTDVFMEMDL